MQKPFPSKVAVCSPWTSSADHHLLYETLRRLPLPSNAATSFSLHFISFQITTNPKLEKYIEASSIPIVTEFNNDPINHVYLSKFFSSSTDKAAIFFLNYTIEATNSLKSKYHEVVELYKGEGISFLIGDNKPSQATLNVLQESIGAID
uniref:Uncharacterized protein n=1 Tax=Cucumis melo TaxID=3656 RepID=A0A9I9EDI2_CUCME